MPLEPVCKTMHMPVATVADVRAVFRKGLSLANLRDTYKNECKRRDLHDHLYYISAVCPEHFSPLQEEVVRLKDKQVRVFGCGLETLMYLLAGTSDAGVEHLTRELANRPDAEGAWARRTMLAAIGSSAALAALGKLAGKSIEGDELERMGFRAPGRGRPVEPRFSKFRQAIAVQPYKGERRALRRLKHPVGLPVSAVMLERKQKDITWHYLTLDLSSVAGLPPLPGAKLHLVSPPINWGWTVFCSVDRNSRYKFHSLDAREADLDDERVRMAGVGYNDRDQTTWAEAVLMPYDDRLTYCNGHTLLSAGVVGNVGGPPIGLYDNPRCPVTGKLMFHVLTVVCHIREYGDGFRSLFVSEDSNLVACNATSWN